MRQLQNKYSGKLTRLTVELVKEILDTVELVAYDHDVKAGIFDDPDPDSFHPLSAP
ncbi:MAG: hypothetical protein M1470_02685 [Bacteroidetes bacterium]|nr:hypothetical protein [Bacteroidota bacterium]